MAAMHQKVAPSKKAGPKPSVQDGFGPAFWRVLNPYRLTLEFVFLKVLVTIPERLTPIYHNLSHFCAILAAVFVVTILSKRFISQASVGDVYGESSYSLAKSAAVVALIPFAASIFEAV